MDILLLKYVALSISAYLSVISAPSPSFIVVNFASSAPRVSEPFVFTESAVTGLKLEPCLSDTMLATSSIITLLTVPLAAFSVTFV